MYTKDGKTYRNIDGEWVAHDESCLCNGCFVKSMTAPVHRNPPDLSEELNNEELHYA